MENSWKVKKKWKGKIIEKLVDEKMLKILFSKFWKDTAILYLLINANLHTIYQSFIIYDGCTATTLWMFDILFFMV